MEKDDLTVRGNIGSGRDAESLTEKIKRHSSSVAPLLWASMLQSLSARGTYGRHIGPIVEADSVVDFVLREPTLPRSVRFCLNGIREELAPLKNNADALKLLERYRRSLSRFNVENASKEQLHDFIDRFQAGLNDLSNTISTTWFLPDGK